MSQHEEGQAIDSTAETVSPGDVAADKKSDLGEQWLRLVFMVLFWIALRISEFVIGLTMLMQFVYRISQGEHQPKLMAFGDSISQYVALIAKFQTYQTDEKPFPFGKWPAPKKPIVSRDKVEVTEEIKASA
ncbi:MAG: DUF4389 domain-containing protein [Thiotrichaceae bacterium]|nr:DUF4389 domain-containing protein [Thiotrichaceae bacterium]PCI14318.1 MAG: hypothetical protein COB71_03060 [Thiotrichales bacterium]